MILSFTSLIATLVGVFCHFCSRTTIAYPTGAPCVAAESMIPLSPHHSDVKNTEAPYSILVQDANSNAVCSYEPNQLYFVEIRASYDISGFLLQPLQVENGEPVKGKRAGQFVEDGGWDTNGIQFQVCNGLNKNSITHTIQMSETPVKSLRIRWKAPDSAEFAGTMQFVMTVVNSLTVYWTDIRSTALPPALSSTCPPPVGCQTGSWSVWGQCVDGQKIRTRPITRTAQNGGTPCLPPDRLREVQLCTANGESNGCDKAVDQWAGQCESSLRQYNGNKDFCCWWTDDYRTTYCKKTCCDKICPKK